MRIRDIIFEDDLGLDPIEDEADTRGDEALITVLYGLRDEAAVSNAVTPRVSINAVIDRVASIPGNEAFNYTLLVNAMNDNETVKKLVKGKPEDDPKTGKKYIYLQPADSIIGGDEDPSDPLGAADAPAGDPSKTVDGMAKRALAKRS